MRGPWPRGMAVSMKGSVMSEVSDGPGSVDIR
jgi:hypothetical protein